MLKISKLSDYGVVVLAALAVTGRNDAAPLAASDLARQTGLPLATVAKLLKQLTKGGMVQSLRGKAGGYVLRRRLSEIKITEVVTAIDGPIKLTECITGMEGGSCMVQHMCAMRGRWDAVNSALHSALGGVTIADMIGAQLEKAA